MISALRLPALVLPIMLMSACGYLRPARPCAVMSCTAAPSPSNGAGPTVSAIDHGWTTSAYANSVSRTISVKLSVPGPLSVDGGCVPSLTAWAIGADGVRIEASPSGAVHCNAISVTAIAEGQTAEFSTTIPLPSHGTYRIHGLLRTHLPFGAGMRVRENIPVVDITVP